MASASADITTSAPTAEVYDLLQAPVAGAGASADVFVSAPTAEVYDIEV